MYSLQPESSFFSMKKKIALVISICIAAIFLGSLHLSNDTAFLSENYLEESEFRQFINTYSKVYSSEEEYAHRFKIFKENLNFIHRKNQESNDWSLKANEFLDVSFEEFRKTYLSSTAFSKKERNPSNSFKFSQEKSIDIPTSVNWVTAGAVTSVKTQGDC